MQEIIQEEETIVSEKALPLIWEFVDTISKIRTMEKVDKICFFKNLSDIYVVMSEENIEIENEIVEKFAQWEATYKLFPELHIFTEEDTCYIPNGVSTI